MDIRSFTTLAESQAPEETIELLNAYYAMIIDATASEGGMVSLMAGDGLMSIFGAPLAREDHRQQSVQAAMQMIELIDLFNQEQALLQRAPIAIGIGIASGPVIAGFVGTQRRATYTCIGDTVNLASRLESHTKVVGQPILIAENTRLGLDSKIQVVPQGEVQVRGKTQTVNIFSVPVARLS